MPSSRDINWLPGMILLGEAVATIDDADRAPRVHERLRPYEGLVVVVGRGTLCGGPVDRVLGMLDRTMDRLDDAERDLADDRERALGLLGDVLGTARRMGARWVVDRALRDRLEAQGLTEVDVT